MKLKNNEEKLRERQNAFVLNAGKAVTDDSEASQI
jgi:hypothetical protein